MLREDDAARDGRRRSGWRARCAGCPTRPTAAPRSGRRDRRRPCRCRARATTSRRSRGGRRASGGPRSRARFSRATEPWCASAISSPASSFSAVARRSASRRLLTKIIVERCARMSSTSRGWIDGQIECRGVPAAAGPDGTLVDDLAQPRHVLDAAPRRVGRTPSAAPRRRSRPGAASTRPSSRRRRRRRAAARPRRAAAASRRARCAGAAARRFAERASSRSSERKRCAPRLVGTSEWISSTITVSTDASISRAPEVSSR